MRQIKIHMRKIPVNSHFSGRSVAVLHLYLFGQLYLLPLFYDPVFGTMDRHALKLPIFFIDPVVFFLSQFKNSRLFFLRISRKIR